MGVRDMGTGPLRPSSALSFKSFKRHSSSVFSVSIPLSVLSGMNVLPVVYSGWYGGFHMLGLMHKNNREN